MVGSPAWVTVRTVEPLTSFRVAPMLLVPVAKPVARPALVIVAAENSEKGNNRTPYSQRKALTGLVRTARLAGI